jgi:hypothetical protein
MAANTREQRERELLSFILHKRQTIVQQYKQAIGLAPDAQLQPGTPAAQMIVKILDREFPEQSEEHRMAK